MCTFVTEVGVTGSSGFWGSLQNDSVPKQQRLSNFTHVNYVIGSTSKCCVIMIQLLEAGEVKASFKMNRKN